MLKFAKMEYVWILSRNAEFPLEEMNKAKKLIKDRLPWYDLSNLYDTKQGGKCRYLPVSEIENYEEEDFFPNLE